MVRALCECVTDFSQFVGAYFGFGSSVSSVMISSGSKKSDRLKRWVFIVLLELDNSWVFQYELVVEAVYLYRAIHFNMKNNTKDGIKFI